MGKKAEESADKKKEVSAGRIFQVSELIDFLVLSELLKEQLYVRELHLKIVDSLKGVGVSVGYLAERLDFMEENKYLQRKWIDEKRYNRHCAITDAGVTYHKMMLTSVRVRIQNGFSFYNAMNGYLKQFDSWSLK